jgi:hypothetical protein
MSVPMDAAVQPLAQRRAMPTWVEFVLGGACVAIVAAQVFLMWRINVNWDEFLYLTHVHALLRGDLNLVFQAAYTHLFTWLPYAGDEMAQVIAARGSMLILFAISAVLIAKLALRWVSMPAALIGLLCFLSAAPVLRHGASFRADSLLLPLVMGAAVLVTRSRSSARTDILIGVLFGVAAAMTIKAVLFAPLLFALAILETRRTQAPLSARMRSFVSRWTLPLLVSVGVFAAIVLLHAWSLPSHAGQGMSDYASTVAHKALFDIPLFPRLDYFVDIVSDDLATWLLVGMGAFAALMRRQWSAAVCVLALLPIAMYRNAFPYFYVVMLAPASVLAALAAEEVRAFASRRASKREWLPLALAAPLLLQAFVHISVLNIDSQWPQRQTVAAVHQVFPRPVPYIDHSGMIASFPKVNFFMSSWGVENYRAAGKGFMREALRQQRPPLLLANRGEIDPTSSSFGRLLPEDRELITRFYLPYWGPIWVAAGHVEAPSEGTVVMALPFPGSYRLAVRHPVAIDGVTRQNGDVLEIPDEDVIVSRAAGTPPERFSVVLVTAEARLPPEEPANFLRLYVGL